MDRFQEKTIWQLKFVIKSMNIFVNCGNKSWSGCPHQFHVGEWLRMHSCSVEMEVEEILEPVPHTADWFPTSSTLKNDNFQN